MGEVNRLFAAAEKLRRKVDDARRRDRDLGGKQRLPRLNRLARKTWAPGIGRPLTRKRRQLPPERTPAAIHNDARDLPEMIQVDVRLQPSRSRQRIVGGSDLRSLRKPPAVKGFRPLSRGLVLC